MVVLNGMANTRDLIFNLMNKRTKLEDELKFQLAILEQNNTDTEEPLIDSDDFPRSDIDVYKVRWARHRIIHIRNDLREIMGEIEKQLHIRHAESKEGRNLMQIDDENSANKSDAVVRVSLVTAGSPADKAGLKPEDLITTFGSLNSTNFESLRDVSAIVNNSVNKEIPITIIRDNRLKKLTLIPQTWSGTGLLGCKIDLIS